jgi:hypothetical protein
MGYRLELNLMVYGCGSMSAEVKAFPNPATQFKGGERLGKPRPAIGKRRPRKLKAALAVAEAVHGPTPVFDGDSIAFLRAVMCGEIRPEPAQMAAAVALAKLERPAPVAKAQVDWAEVCQEAADKWRAKQLTIDGQRIVDRASMP